MMKHVLNIISAFIVETLCIVSLLMVPTGKLSSQSLSLDACKQMALQNNVAVKNARIDVEAAREVKSQAFTKYFPNVTAMAGGYYALKPLVEYGIEDVDNAALRNWLQNLYFEYGAGLGFPNKLSFCENGIVVGATALQPVFMGGQIVNGNKLASVGIRAAVRGALRECRRPPRPA